MKLKMVYGQYTILGLYRIWYMAPILWFICSLRKASKLESLNASVSHHGGFGAAMMAHRLVGKRTKTIRAVSSWMEAGGQ